MMDTSKEFTEEATQVLESYVKSVGLALKETELTENEIDESINELRYHILSQCEIRAKSNIVTTDLVKLSIKKLGDPKTIAESLKSELNFIEDLQNEDAEKRTIGDERSNNEIKKSGFKVRAGHLSALYGTFSWLMTSVVIFIVFSSEFIYLSWLYPFLYAITAAILISTRNIDAYMYNKHLQKFVKPNYHTNVIPFVYFFITLIFELSWPTSYLWTMPATIIIWLILSSTEYGRRFYKDQIIEIIAQFQQIGQSIKDE